MKVLFPILLLWLYSMRIGSAEEGVFLDVFYSSIWSKFHAHTSPKALKATFTVALNIKSIERMRAEFLSISNPLSQNYSNYLSIEEINNKYGPTLEEQNVVINFFRSIEGAIVEPNKHNDFLRITAKVEHIERILDTELDWHNHVSYPDYLVLRVKLNSKESKVELQIEVDADVESVPQPSQSVSKPSTADMIAKLYNLPKGYRTRLGSQAVVDFNGNSFSNEDLDQFLSLSGLESASIPPNQIYGELPNNPENTNGFSLNLDVQYMTALASGVPTYIYSMKDNNPYTSDNEGLLEYLWLVGNQSHPPLVHVLHYADSEKNVFTMGKDNSLQIELEFIKMGLRGLTVLVGSGDHGSGDGFDDSDRCGHTSPEWPASSPYVTTVGASQLSTDFIRMCSYLNSQKCTAAAEIPMSSYTTGDSTTGGGFSEIYNREQQSPWQHDVVEYYIEDEDNVPEFDGFFNETGRAYPDITALGYRFLTVNKKSIQYVSGTSASTAVIASVVSLLNDLRLQQGKAPMGFINPFLYYALSKRPDAFHDIIRGNNGCSTRGVSCCTQCYSAAPGWDAVSGVGSPNFKILAQLALTTDF
eukprot:gene8372-17263_t